MITKRQKEELQEQFNHYSYWAELNKRMGKVSEYNTNISKMCALKDAFYALGYTFKCEKQNEKGGIKYYYYEFFKE